MRLSSGIFKKYSKNFLLDEDGLRRIEGILLKAQHEYPEGLSLLYHLEREDNRFYESQDLDEILQDPNVTEKRVKLISVKLQTSYHDLSPNDIRVHDIVSIVFSKEHPLVPVPFIEFKINALNRTWALMLSDELDPQICRLFKIKSMPVWMLFPYMLLFGLIGFKLAILFGKTWIEALKMSGTSIIVATMLSVAAMVGLIFLERPNWFRKYIIGESVFLWGDEIHNFSLRERTRSNIFWAILVGFLISFAAGVVSLLI